MNHELHRAERIMQHPLFAQEYQRLQQAEQGRSFCRHNYSHFLDVARVCWIAVLEQGLAYRKDVVYAAALLHDLGKGLQYTVGTPHHEASAALAQDILPDCGYAEDEIACIVSAIRLHRNRVENDEPLVALLYMADKKTRLCFDCNAADECNWSDEKKNNSII